MLCSRWGDEGDARRKPDSIPATIPWPCPCLYWFSFGSCPRSSPEWVSDWVTVWRDRIFIFYASPFDHLEIMRSIRKRSVGTECSLFIRLRKSGVSIVNFIEFHLIGYRKAFKVASPQVKCGVTLDTIRNGHIQLIRPIGMHSFGHPLPSTMHNLVPSN